jgi:hypothetical protein
MYVRLRLSGFSILCLACASVGCSNPQGLDSVVVSPASQSLAVGQTVQFTATGTFGNAKHPSTQNITSLVTWTSSLPSVATISASGVATAVSPGTTTITASATAFNGPISSSAALTVPGSTGTVAGGSSGSSGSGGSGSSGANILSLTIIPSGIDLAHIRDSGQFLAIATFSSAPTVRDVTNQVTWFTSEPNKFPVTNNIASGAPGAGTQNGGVASAYESSTGPVGAIITAEMTDSNGSIATATAGVGCSFKNPDNTTNPPTPGHCDQPAQQLLSTLTVYNEGLNSGASGSATTGNWLLTAPSATGTPTVLHCGPGWAANGGTGGSVCTATYPLFTNGLPTAVTITAPAQTGVRFGGWSSNCTNTGTITAIGPNTCTIFLGSSDATVGAIFN